MSRNYYKGPSYRWLQTVNDVMLRCILGLVVCAGVVGVAVTVMVVCDCAFRVVFGQGLMP